jgi:hypothetical protein
LFLSVPNVPAWKCDICQYLEFDDHAMIQLELLVGHSGLPADSDRRAAKLPPLDADAPEGKRPPRMKP